MTMQQESTRINDMVLRFANVNGTGSASANELFAKSVFRMGIPVTAKNIFPSNIQGLPTWYEIRISGDGYLARREGIDILVAVNPQSLEKDIKSVRPGGYLIYDNSKMLYDELKRDDINFIGIPMIRLAAENYEVPRLQQLFKNMIYVGAIATLINLDIEVVKETIAEKFKAKQKLIPANHQALDLGVNYVKENLSYPLPLSLEKADNTNNHIVIDGNTACALGAIYGGASMMAWYPITPSTSVAKAFETYCKKLRIDRETGKKKYAIVQAEDELAAIGMVIGANWNGARAFTSTSGAGVSLMNEFIGLSYFAEIPSVLINVQRGGPSTGMPTRTQQADILSSAYASHGDTKHPMLIPSTPRECFEYTAMAFDLAERLQTLVFVITDLDLGMNQHMSEPLEWKDIENYDRGKVLDEDMLESMTEDFGRYLDTDGDGIPYRTIPGTHPTKGAFFTRGTSRDEYAKYTEDGAAYVRNVDRLKRKWETAKTLVPDAQIKKAGKHTNEALLFYGTSQYAADEAIELLEKEGIYFNSINIKAFPFGPELRNAVNSHDKIYVIDQNRDGQMKSLLSIEEQIAPDKMISILNYDGMPITADHIFKSVLSHKTQIAQV